MKWWKRFSSEGCIVFSNHSARCLKGKIHQWQLNSIADDLREQEIHHGEIWIAESGQITFSREIPAILHQRLRNIIAG
jgi:hypothetical protein